VKLRHRIVAFATIGAVLIAIAAYGTLSPVRTDASLLDAHVEAALITDRMVTHAQEAGRLGEAYVANGQPEELLAFWTSAALFESDLASYERSAGDVDHGEGDFEAIDSEDGLQHLSL
jgi:hypothetical protein